MFSWKSPPPPSPLSRIFYARKRGGGKQNVVFPRLPIPEHLKKFFSCCHLLLTPLLLLAFPVSVSLLATYEEAWPPCHLAWPQAYRSSCRGGASERERNKTRELLSSCSADKKFGNIAANYEINIAQRSIIIFSDSLSSNLR